MSISAGAPPNVFISYRRDDAPAHAGRLADHLTLALGEGSVFMDIDSIGAGADFMREVTAAIGKADVVLVVIGPGWNKERADGSHRLDDERDFVRAEIEVAISSPVRVIPILVGGAVMQPEPELPSTIAPLARLNAVELLDRRWREDVGTLLELLRRRPHRCASCGKENADDAATCIKCGSALISDIESRETRKSITALSCAVSLGTDSGGAVDPETHRAVVGRVIERIVRAIEAEGGLVRPSAGAMAIGLFGVPSVHEDDALRAVRAAVEIRDGIRSDETLSSDEVDVTTRIALCTGDVVISLADGSVPDVSGVVLASAPSLAYALAPRDIALDGTTVRLIRDAAQVETLDRASGTYRLVQLEATATAGITRHRGPVFVGRTRERRLLETSLERVREESRCGLFTIIGSPGVGKSRLVAEVLASSDAMDVLTGRCLPYGEGNTFWPVTEILKQAAHVEEGDRSDQVRDKVWALVQADPQAEEIGRTLLSIVGTEPASGSIEQTFWGVQRLLEQLARERPLVVVIDDIQWAEPALLALIEHLIDRVTRAPVLLVCLARPELLDTRPDWGGGVVDASSVRLEPLSVEESSELAAAWLDAGLEDALLATVSRSAGGNPLFIEELLAMLVDDKMLERRGERWVAIGDLSEVRVPPTISAVVAARLDRLAPEESTLVQGASVVGEVFQKGAVEAVAPERLAPDVGAYLRRLARKDLIRPEEELVVGEEAYRFRHLVIRDAAYGTLPTTMRAELHERVADWIERMAGGRISEYDEIVGYHLEQAWRNATSIEDETSTNVAIKARAAEHLSRAASRAFDLGDANAAADLFERAAASESDRHAEVRRLLDAVDAHVMSGRLSRAVEVAEHARVTAGAGDDAGGRWSAELARRGCLQLVDPRTDERVTEEFATQAINELTEIGDDAALSRAWSSFGSLMWLPCRFDAALEAYQRASDHAQRSGDERMIRDARDAIVSALQLGSTPAPEAAERARMLLDTSRSGGVWGAALEAVDANFMSMLGDAERARGMCDAGLQVAEEAKLHRAIAVWLEVGGLIERRHGDPARLESLTRQLYDLLVDAGNRWQASTAAGMLSEALCDLGSFGEAGELATVARETSSEDDFASQIQALRASAHIAAVAGARSNAVELLNEAIVMCGSVEFPEEVGLTHLRASIVYETLGDPENAVEQAKIAKGHFSTKGILPLMARAEERALGLS